MVFPLRRSLLFKVQSFDLNCYVRLNNLISKDFAPSKAKFVTILNLFLSQICDYSQFKQAKRTIILYLVRNLLQFGI